MDLPNLFPSYHTSLVRLHRQAAIVMLAAFIVTYIAARTYTRIARRRRWSSAKINGIHTHHMVFGLIIAFIAGSLEFTLLPRQLAGRLVLAGLFGMGVALVLDEFALILHLQDVYWEKEGRKSIDAIVIGLILGLLFLLNIMPFGTEQGQSFRIVALAIGINVPILIITALKGKLFTAVFGVFIPFVSLVGAIRLAEPDSLWARRRYPPSGEKDTRSRQRFRKYHDTLHVWKERLYDVIGGKTGRL